ncbi:MAG: hypothetical protein IIU11_10730 [Bacteroidales bacterium]|nr:hypothetical protein [Bacteroidales bacterium]
MKLKIDKVLIKMRLACIVLVPFFAVFSYYDVNAQGLFKSYEKLSTPEKHWVLTHPLAAKKIFKISSLVKDEVKKHQKDTLLDGDVVGGTLDAFKHTLWMALCAQKIGKKRALLLGQAHEDGNRLDFLKNGQKKYIGQDSVLSRMDMLNNQVGAQIGVEYPNLGVDSLTQIVIKNIVEGNCFKVKKNSKRRSLDKDGNIIDENKYPGVWNIPKVLIKSNGLGEI